MNTPSVLVLLIGLLLPALAGAAEIRVTGLSSNHFWGSYPFRNSRFNVRYMNDDLPLGSTVRMAYGRRCMGVAWQTRFPAAELKPSAERVWEGSVELQSAGQEIGICDEFEFTFELRLPDGRILQDNGGLGPNGHYATRIPVEREIELILPVERKP